jgi:hypothetical protein
MTENPIPWRVIRAAPDMLEALEAIRPVLTQLHYCGPLIEVIDAAIAKANGELQPEERKEYAAK